MKFDYTLEPGKILFDRKLKTDGTPLISIITPYYNGGKYIEQTYRCVENQTFPWFEWIIVDDGSTEQRSLEILDKLAKSDPRIRVIHKKNGGAASARNCAIREAKSDLIFPLDCDDLEEPTSLEYCWWMLLKNPGAAWAHTASCGFDSQEYLWDVPYNPLTLKAQNILNVTALIRKSWLDKIGGYDETIAKYYHEDWHLWLRLIALGAYPVQTTQEYLHWYRRTENGNLAIAEKDPVFSAINKKAIQEAAERVIDPKAPIIYPRPISGKWHTPKVSPFDREIFSQHKKIQVTFLIPWFEIGGADKFNLDLIHGLNKEQFEVGIITTVPSKNPWLQEFRKDVADIFNLPNFVDQEDYAEFLSYYIKTRQVDILFVSNSYHGYYMIPWLRQQFPQLAIVDYVHMEEWYWKGGGYARTSGAIGSITEKTYTCNSATTEVLVKQFARTSETVETVHIGVDEKYFQRDIIRSGITYERLNIHRDRPIVLFICRLHPQKRPFLMLEIAKRVRKEIKNIAFVVVGDGPQKKELESAVRSKDLNHTVYFAGAQREVRPFYQDAKVTLICSLKEGLSLTSYESCSMGVPVVTSDVGGQKDLIDNTVGALIPCSQNESADLDVRIFSEEEVEAYSNAIINILSDEAKWQSMSIASRARIEKAFTIKGMVQYFENEFTRLKADKTLLAERLNKANALNILSPLAADYFTIELQEQAAEENHGFYYFNLNDQNTANIPDERERLFWLESQVHNISNQLNNHEEVLNRHEEVVNRHEEVANRHEEVVNRHEEVINRHEEVVNRHEEVLNRHEEVVNRHEQVVNDDWAWLKELTNRIEKLEANSVITSNSFVNKIVNKIFNK